MSSSSQAQDRGKEKVGFKRTKSKSVRRSQDEVYLSAFKDCEFVQTRWAHKPTLEKLGLLNDVRTLLDNIGLQNLLDMDYLTYPEEVAHLLATFEVDITKSKPPPSIDDLGRVRFKVKGIRYELSIKDLCLAYGFKLDYGGKVQYDHDSDREIWGCIGREQYKPSKAKAATIGNPSVRYVHKLISQTLFARKEADKVKEEEMALLVNGIYPLHEDWFFMDNLTEYKGLNLGVLFAKQVRKIKKEWVLKQAPGATVYIGGFLTPLLLACKVPLGTPSDKPRNYLDMNNLVRIHFLGKSRNRFVYNFFSTQGESKQTYLPNPRLMGLFNKEHLGFTFPDSFMNQTEVEPGPQQEESTGEGSSNQGNPLGSARYNHPPYQGRIQGGVKHALEGVAKNQRRGKWLSKSLHNVTSGLRKKIKTLEGTVSDLKSIVETFVLRRRSPPRDEDGSTSYEAALEVARRNSISHPPSFDDMGDREGPRPSSYERRQRRRKHRHIPTPSPPSSDNELYHLSDSYSEG